MQKQTLSNHIRYYYPHHFIFYPLVTFFVGFSIYCAYTHDTQRSEWIAFAACFFLIGWLSYMVRQHYALTIQDRTIRLELRLRYFELTQKRLEFVEYKLSLTQLFALRFADDEQLPQLIQQTLEENLSPVDIKKRISNWQPDNMRV